MRARAATIFAVMTCAVVFAPSAFAHDGGHGGPWSWGHGHHHPSSLVVPTRDGALQGETAAGVDQWLGIPYAAPPVGSLRWKPPEPAAAWHGVRPALTLPPACPQLPSGNGPRSENEDCLYLSIYRPAGVSRHERLPVLVWIHGGGLTTGSGNQHNGALMATTNHIEVVSINYRLGMFGFLALPSLSAESPDHASGDYGLQDQEAALRWTHWNIAGFGGDPRNVTIAGESAGGYSVCSLLTSPPVRGLFQRAVIQSGSCISTPLSSAEQSGAAFASALGCSDPSSAASCMRSKTPAQLLDDPQYPGALSPTSGGPELPVPPASAVSAGRFDHVPLLIGTNHDEARTFAQGFANAPESVYVQTIDSEFGANAGKVLAEYPWSSFPSPYTTAYAIGAVWTDSGFTGGIGGCATQNLAGQFGAGTRTFFYQFDDRHAPGLNNQVPGYQWGAGHAMELAYMWPSFNNGFSLYDEFTPAQKQLSDQMVRWWGAFARFGAPLVHGQPYWPSYQRDQIMSLRPGDQSTPISNAEFGAEHNCTFWASIPGAVGGGS
ncbi:MAG: carboxylesterase family protein [Solirubrobacteraceae bacterium]